MCRTAVSGKQVRYRNILCPQKEEDLNSRVIQVYFRLVYFYFFSPGATTPIGGCILQPSSGL